MLIYVNKYMQAASAAAQPAPAIHLVWSEEGSSGDQRYLPLLGTCMYIYICI